MPLIVLLGAACLFGSVTLHAAVRLVVNAGDTDREAAVVRFAVPPEFPNSAVLRSGAFLAPVQVMGREASFIARQLKRGEKRTYTVEAGATTNAAWAETNAGSVTLRVGGKTALVYRAMKTQLPPNRPDLKPIFQRGGYIHPVLSPSGLQVTDDYPSNHRHHHGIWFAWTKTEFEGRQPDFWNMGDGKGTVEFEGLEYAWSGPVHAGFSSRHRQVDLTAGEPRNALNERWTLHLYAVGADARQPYFVFDLTVTDACATDAPVKLPQYRYGGIGVRGNWAWNGRTNLSFLANNGSTDRTKGDKGATRGNWAHMGGRLGDTFTGIAIISHPSNVFSPQPMRIHPDEPFFNFAPQQAGDVVIAPGQPLTLRYRFVVADGPPNHALLESLWRDYAEPPRVSVLKE